MIKTKIVQQSQLTADCWSIQVWGIEACETCEFRDTRKCGGKSIIKKIKARKFPADGLGVRT
jgi:hypothetical protein